MIWIQKEQYQHLLTFEDETGIVVVFAILNTVFLLVLSLMRKNRVKRALTAMIISLAVLPLCFPLSQFSDFYTRIYETQNFQCPREKVKIGGFDFSFTDHETVIDEPKEKRKSIIESPPCIGRYKGEPYLSFFLRRLKIGFLQMKFSYQNFSPARYLTAQLFKFRSAVNGLWTVRVKEKTNRPNIYLLHEDSLDQSNIKKAFHYLFRKGDVVQAVLLEENLHLQKMTKKCNEVEPDDLADLEFIPFEILDKNCKDLAINRELKECYGKLSKGKPNDCSFEKVRVVASEGSYLKRREYYCDNDSLERNTVIICLSRNSKDMNIQRFKKGERDYILHYLGAENRVKSVIMAFKSMLANGFSSDAIENKKTTNTKTILDEYDSYVSPKAGLINRDIFTYILEYQELQQIRKNFLQKFSGVLNEK